LKSLSNFLRVSPIGELLSFKSHRSRGVVASARKSGSGGAAP